VIYREIPRGDVRGVTGSLDREDLPEGFPNADGRVDDVRLCPSVVKLETRLRESAPPASA
jgi:hypothetical protein